MAFSSFFSIHLFLLSLIYILLCLLHIVSCIEDPTVEMQLKWMATFQKVYEDEAEKEHRFKIFSENLKYIRGFNKAKNRSYTLGINRFTDLTNAEFSALVGRGKVNEKRFKRFENLTDEAPDSVDWREVGAVTPVKNQNPCGSCWTFAPVASIEGLVKIKTGKLISLSEQQLLDCVNVSSGCTEGYPDESFNFVVSNGGITTEADYPYNATQMTCNTTKLSHKAASIKGHEYVVQNDEYQLMLRVAKQPVVAFVSSFGIQHYSGGIFSGDCGTQRDHFVTLVGYGRDVNGVKFWIAKNSWGSEWGEDGYIYFEKDVTDARGTCGLATNPMYPT